MRIIIDRKKSSPVHLIWGPIAIAAIVVAGFVTHFFHDLPSCPFKVITGYPCLTCGGTRCLAELSHLALWESFKFNPFIWLTALGMIIFSLSLLLSRLIKRQLTISLSENEKKAIRIAIVAVAAINWIYLIISLK